MPALRCPLRVEAGSYDPEYWVFNDSETGEPVDLTQPGYLVTGLVATRPSGQGTTLIDLPDDSVWRRTSDGRVYFEPHSATSTVWTFRSGYYQVELSHPSGEVFRFTQGRFYVDAELVTP